ncbi:hypothetical protein K1719_008223 [Acacia pycnantha]|nr:hypothetical protein K1719_008223 [Acacia pycnantha]
MGIVDYAWSHAVISDELHREIRESCDFKSSDPWKNQTCCDAVDELLAQYHKIDMYSLYTPVCFASTASSSNNNQYSTQGFMSYKRTVKMIPRIMGGFDPCLDDYATAFFNRPDVQKALHVSNGHSIKNWSICNYNIFYHWKDSKPSVIPSYKKLISAGHNLGLQVSGWFQEYEGLTFAGGAGHDVPSFKPSNSLAFFSSFLLGQSPPETK